uniref:Uncharacterized protein n=1 Tax=Tetranychus evansi TaxID=178897 RepID=A0A3G5APE6_9ACAR|nr:hypothetical protein 3 [Tetranychus evansi]
MRFLIILTFFAGLSWCQQTQIETSVNDDQGRIVISGNSGRLIDMFLHPLRPFLGEAGHKALHNALETIPMSVLNQVSNLGQLFGALITFNPTAVPKLINQFFPGASSFLNLLPSFGSAGLGALTSLTGSSSRFAGNLFGSNSFANRFGQRQGFPSFSSQPSNSFSTSNSAATTATSSPSLRGNFSPANIASDLVGQGLSNFAGVTNSLASGQPLSALLTMAGSAADSVNRFGNLAATGANMASGLASRIPNTVSQLSNRFSSMVPGASLSPFRASSSASLNPGQANERSSASFSSPLNSLLRSNPFTAFLAGR